jgi:hypothetical protein
MVGGAHRGGGRTDDGPQALEEGERSEAGQTSDDEDALEDARA